MRENKLFMYFKRASDSIRKELGYLLGHLDP